MPRPADTPSDPAAHVASARAGEAAAWGPLLSRYQLPLFTYVQELLRHETAALDLVLPARVREGGRRLVQVSRAWHCTSHDERGQEAGVGKQVARHARRKPPALTTCMARARGRAGSFRFQVRQSGFTAPPS